MRDAGYAQYVSKHDDHVSYVRRVAGYEFPRFHVYVDESGALPTISIHIDQKGVIYEGAAHAHNGEYTGPLIQEELLRMRDAIGIQFIVLNSER